MLNLDFGTLKEAHETEGPALPELETLLNMLWNFSLIDVAEENFKLRGTVINLFDKWKNQQDKISEMLNVT
jgi:hypothetical protein